MLYEKITQLNQTVVECLNEIDEVKVIKAFTDIGIKILDADFGFVWLNSYASSELTLVYKSTRTPYTPLPPQKDGRNYSVIKNREPDYVKIVKKRADKSDVSRYMKSFVIIPISFRAKTYGNIVICFKKQESFAREKKILCEFIGTVVAQAITIRRLMSSEQEKAKTEFLAEATHELRTPLAIIKGNVDLALRGNSKNPQEIKRTLRDIDYEVNHMSGLVSDLSVLVTDNASFNRKREARHIRLGEILEQTIKRFSIQAAKKYISLSLDMGDVPDVVITGDRLYFDKMFGNVVKNALVYGREKGSVAITCSLGHASVSASNELNRKSVVHVDVADDGIGIPKGDIPHVFDRFYRAPNAREKNHEGTGLGLAIVKFIVEAHEGNVSLLKSQEKKGSTFRLTLPVFSVA